MDISFTPKQLDHLWSRIEQGTNGGCWIWQGHRNDRGYGVVRFNKRFYKVHRLMYRLAGGYLDDTLVIDHLCENKACCNPEHLEAVSNSENSRRHYQRHPIIKKPKQTGGYSRHIRLCGSGHELEFKRTRCRCCEQQSLVLEMSDKAVRQKLMGFLNQIRKFDDRRLHKRKRRAWKQTIDWESILADLEFD